MNENLHYPFDEEELVKFMSKQDTDEKCKSEDEIVQFLKENKDKLTRGQIGKLARYLGLENAAKFLSTGLEWSDWKENRKTLTRESILDEINHWKPNKGCSYQSIHTRNEGKAHYISYFKLWQWLLNKKIDFPF